MALLDWSQCPAVESIPGKVSGAWVFRNTRMPVSIVFENLEAGATFDEIVEWFDVTPEQVKAVIEFAARSLEALASRRNRPRVFELPRDIHVHLLSVPSDFHLHVALCNYRLADGGLEEAELKLFGLGSFSSTGLREAQKD